MPQMFLMCSGTGDGFGQHMIRVYRLSVSDHRALVLTFSTTALAPKRQAEIGKRKPLDDLHSKEKREPPAELIQHEIAQRYGGPLPGEGLIRRCRAREARREASHADRVGGSGSQDASGCQEIEASDVGRGDGDGTASRIENAYRCAGYSHPVRINDVAGDGIGNQADFKAVDDTLHVEQENAHGIECGAGDNAGRGDMLAALRLDLIFKRGQDIDGGLEISGGLRGRNLASQCVTDPGVVDAPGNKKIADQFADAGWRRCDGDVGCRGMAQRVRSAGHGQREI
jgi:hypothetical protein